MNKNIKFSEGKINSLGKYIQTELISEMSNPEMMIRNNKLIVLMSRAANNGLNGKKIQINKPFSNDKMLHNNIVTFFEQYNITVDKKY